MFCDSIDSLMSIIKETHEKYFYGTEHWNYFTNDEVLILSLIYSRFLFVLRLHLFYRF